jgi:hypothetical protein
MPFKGGGMRFSTCRRGLCSSNGEDGIQIVDFILSSLVSSCTSSFAKLGFHGSMAWTSYTGT